MNEKKKISLVHLDALKEIGTISAGRAATALAEMLNCKVEINVPEVKIFPLELLNKVLGKPDDLFFVLDINMEGEIKGRWFFLLPPNEAKVLGASLLNKKSEEIDIEDPLFQSSLKEITNILTAAYFNALSEMTNLVFLYNPPSLAIDMVGALLDFFFIQIAQYAEEVIFIKTQLEIEGIGFQGLILFFPEMESLVKLLEKLGVKE